jgi:hypothetical protein
MIMRETLPGDYWIIAVLYETLERPGITVNPEDIHGYALNPPPLFIGYMRIPASYVHR